MNTPSKLVKQIAANVVTHLNALPEEVTEEERVKLVSSIIFESLFPLIAVYHPERSR